MGGVVGRYELVYGLLSRSLHRFDGVGEDEGVEVHHDGVQNALVLRDPIALEYHVQDLLVVLAEHLEPAGITLRQDIIVLTPDSNRSCHGAIHHDHHDRQVHRARHEQDLVHQGEALGRGSRKTPHPCGLGGHAGAHRAVFALHRHKVGVQATICDELRDVLDDRGLGGDGVGGHELRPREDGAIGSGVVPGHHSMNGTCHTAPLGLQATTSSVACMRMAPVGHTWAQIPHPLQW